MVSNALGRLILSNPYPLHTSSPREIAHLEESYHFIKSWISDLVRTLETELLGGHLEVVERGIMEYKAKVWSLAVEEDLE